MPVGYTDIVGKFTRAVVDGPDSDRDPDRIPIEGLQFEFVVDLKPAVAKDTAAKETVYLDPIPATTDAAGILIGPDGLPGIRLTASDSPDLDPNGWTYTVTTKGAGLPTLKTTFVTESGKTLDFSDIIAVPPSPGNQIPAWTAVVSQATSAAAVATEAKEEAIAAAESVQRDQPNGVAPIGADKKIPEPNLPTRLSEAGLSATIAQVTATAVGGAIDEANIPGVVAFEVLGQAGKAVTGLACYGDSMTQGSGGGGTNYPAVLDTLVPVTVANYGIASQQSFEIALRNGGLDVFVTVSGGSIPASGSVVVTVLPALNWRAGSAWSFPGTLEGVPGVLAKSAATPAVWTFTRNASGSAVPVRPESRFQSAQQAPAGVGRIIWVGRNNPTLPQPATDVRAMAAEAQRVGAPYIVLPIFNQESEPSGSSGYTNVMATNAELAKDPNFYDMRGYMIRNGLADAGISATAADTTAISEDRIPPSLMSDAIHLNAAGYTVVGKRLAALTAAKGWYTSSVIIPTPPAPTLPALTVPNVLRRYSAIPTTEAAGATVSVLTNFGSASGGMAAQSGAPTKRVSGRPYLEFDGTDDWMRSAVSDASIGAGALTLYGVARFRGTPSSGNWPVVANHFGGQTALSKAPGAALVAFRDSAFTAGSLVPGTDWHIFIVVFNGSSSVIRMDNVAEATGTLGTAAPALMEVGRNTNSAGFAQVDIAEFGSFGRALDATERAQLVTDLKAIYALT